MKSFTLFFIFLITASNQCFSQTLLSTDNFNSGWGIWNSGGANSILSNPSPLDLGHSIELKNGTVTSNTYTNEIDMSPYELASLEFIFRTTGFSDGEEFYLEYSSNGGVKYSIISTYTVGINTINNVNYSRTISVNNADYPLTANSKFRFRSNGNC